MEDHDLSRKRERLHQKTFERAVNLLTYRARSVAELRERLLEKPWAERDIVEQVIEKLLGYGYLNDREFAREFACARLRQKPIGRRVLLQKLKHKKLDPETIQYALDQSFEHVPESQLIEDAIERRVRCKGLPKNYLESRKLFEYLLRQGFPSGLIGERLRALMVGSNG